MTPLELEGAISRALAPIHHKIDRLDNRLFRDKDSIAVEITEQRERLKSLSDKVESIKTRKPSRFNWRGFSGLVVAVVLAVAGIFGPTSPRAGAKRLPYTHGP